MLSHTSHIWLFATPWIIAHQTTLSMEFSRKEYWSGWLFFSPEYLPNPGIEPILHLLLCQVRSLPLGPPGKPNQWIHHINRKKGTNITWSSLCIQNSHLTKFNIFMWKKKILHKLEAVENFLNMINNLLNPAVNIIFNNKAMDIFLQKSGTR